jgi:purine-binding chemotaxis protein CheW
LGAELQRKPLFVFSVGVRLCALPVDCVSEIMRPTALQPLPGAPAFLAGVSQVRGLPTPVVDSSRVLGGPALEQPERQITITIARTRQAALLVTAVVGIRTDTEHLNESLPWLDNSSSEIIAELARFDGELLTVLRAGSVVPDDAWPEISRV